ncbi:MAG: DUF6364 family protein [Edaphocola sp.]
MKATLNLRFDKQTINEAKEYARKEQTSVSEIVETYLKKLTARTQKKKFASDTLIGILKEYQNCTDEELRTLYAKGKHGA